MSKQLLASAAVLMAAFTLAPAANAQYSEDFETLTVGPLEGQGGFANWDTCATGNQIFNTVSTAQARSGAQAARVLGSTAAAPGSACAFCSDTVHLMNGPYTSGQWTFSIWTYLPASYFGDTYIIMLNDYADCGGPYNWSGQTHFDSLAGISGTLVADLSGAANPITLGGDQPIIYDAWVEYKLEIDLDNDVATMYYDCVPMYEYTWSLGVSGGGGTPTIDALDLFPGTDDTTEIFYDDISLTAGITGSCPIGMNYCMANMNSTGNTGVMSAAGSSVALDNSVVLTASSLPNNSFGFFITSQTQGFVANPAGSAGNLCVLGAIGRYVGAGQIQLTGTTGAFSLVLDLTQTPTPTGFVTVMMNETWNFQAWHRDSSPAGPTSNFTDGLEINFL